MYITNEAQKVVATALFTYFTKDGAVPIISNVDNVRKHDYKCSYADYLFE